jgi:hypothetical protein
MRQKSPVSLAQRGLQRAAADRGTRPGRLGRLVIETVVNDKLIDAIIDDAPPKKHHAAGSTMGGPLWPANASRR